MKKQLNTKEQWFANTGDEANKIVEEAKEEFVNELIGYSIQEKSNKTGEYYLVKLDMKYNTPAGIMESELLNDEDTTDWEDTDENIIAEGENE